MIKQALIGIIGASFLTACGQAPIMNAAPAPRPAIMNKFQAQQNKQLLIRFRTEMDRTGSREFEAKYGVRILRYVPSLDVYVAQIDASVNLEAAQVASFLMQDRHVAHAEVNYQMSVSPIPQMKVSPIID